MAIWGGSFSTPYAPDGSSLYGQQNELIAFKPQVISDDSLDWWTAGPDAFDVTRSEGLFVYDKRTTSSRKGLLAWIGPAATDKNDLTWAAPLNRAATITGLWNFNVAARGPSTTPGSNSPFTIGSQNAETEDILSNWVHWLNADRVDGYHAHKFECSDTLGTAINNIPVYKDQGRLTVGFPTDACDATPKSYVDLIGPGKPPIASVQWATTVLLDAVVSNGNMRLTNIGSLAAFNPDPVAGTRQPAVNDRVLVKNQTTLAQHGIYSITTLGAPSTPGPGVAWVLDRTADANETDEIKQGTTVAVDFGGVNVGSQWSLITEPPNITPFVPGTTAHKWNKTFQVPTYTGGKGIKILGSVISFFADQNTNYNIGSLFSPSSGSVLGEIVTPTSLPAPTGAPRYFLSNPGTATMPTWSGLFLADIRDRSTGTVGRVPYWSTVDRLGDTTLVWDLSGNPRILRPNADDQSNQVDVGTVLIPFNQGFFKNGHIDTLNLKAARGTSLALLTGWDFDPAIGRETVKSYTAAQVWAWLNPTPSIPATATAELLEGNGIIITTPPTTPAVFEQLLKDSPSWTISVDPNEILGPQGTTGRLTRWRSPFGIENSIVFNGDTAGVVKDTALTVDYTTAGRLTLAADNEAVSNVSAENLIIIQGRNGGANINTAVLGTGTIFGDANFLGLGTNLASMGFRVLGTGTTQEALRLSSQGGSGNIYWGTAVQHQNSIHRWITNVDAPPRYMKIVTLPAYDSGNSQDLVVITLRGGLYTGVSGELVAHAKARGGTASSLQTFTYATTGSFSRSNCGLAVYHNPDKTTSIYIVFKIQFVSLSMTIDFAGWNSVAAVVVHDPPVVGVPTGTLEVVGGVNSDTTDTAKRPGSNLDYGGITAWAKVTAKAANQTSLTAASRVAVFASDPSTDPVDVTAADQTTMRNWLGAAGGSGTQYRIAKFTTATTLGDTVALVENGDLYWNPTAGSRYSSYLHGHVEHLNQGFLNLSTVGFPIKQGFFSNLLANWDSHPFIAQTAIFSTTGTVAESVPGVGNWRLAYRPYYGGTTLQLNESCRAMASFVGSGTIVYEFLSPATYQLPCPYAPIYQPYVVIQQNDGSLASVKVEFRSGDYATWVTVIDDAPPTMMVGINSLWRGPAYAPANVSGKYVTGVRFTLGWNSAGARGIYEIGIANANVNTGDGVVGYTHRTNRWLASQIFSNVATWSSGATHSVPSYGGGSVSAALVAIGQANTGFYTTALGQLDFTANGSRMATLTSTGLGVGMFTPTAWLELAGGNTSKAPLKIGSSGSALLTTPVSGAIEFNNDRIFWTNNTDWCGDPVNPATLTKRHPFAAYDDLNFTDDGNGDMAGCMVMQDVKEDPGGTPVTVACRAQSTLTGQNLGTGDFTVWLRLKIPQTAPPSGLGHGFFAISGNPGNGGGPFELYAGGMNGAIDVNVTVRTETGSSSGSSRYLPLGSYAGKIIDLCLVRTSGVLAWWVNANPVGTTNTGGSYEGSPIGNNPATTYFKVGSVADVYAGYPDRIYRAALFNRALNAYELRLLSLNGVHNSDQWGSTAVYQQLDLTTTSLHGARTDVTFNVLGGPAGDQRTGCVQAIGQASNASHYLYWWINAPFMFGTSKTYSWRYRLDCEAYAPATNVKVTKLTSVSSRVTAVFNGQNSQVITGAWNNVSLTAQNEEDVMRLALGAGGVGGDFPYYDGSGAPEPAFVRNLKVYQVGCLVNLDFGYVLGSQPVTGGIPPIHVKSGMVKDWSGRYPAVMAGQYQLIRNKTEGTTVINPVTNVTVTGNLRMWSKVVAALDDEAQTITHGLNKPTYGLMVVAWDALSNHQLDIGVVRQTADTVQVTFGKIGAPVTRKNVEIVVVG
jgi:hypothetical protein